MNSYLGIKDPATAASAVVAACTLTLAACGGGGGGGGMTMNTTPPPPPGFVDTALDSNAVGVVATTTIIDANLQNPWGLAFQPTFPFWIADSASNVTTLYDGTGTVETGVITGANATGITIPAGSTGPALPTGEVYNGTGGFPVGGQTATFIFAGQAGTIVGWASGDSAATAYDDAIANPASPAVYKGLAIGAVSGANFLYATDFHNNKIDVFDTNYTLPAAMQHLFVDPTMPAGFAPFGITAVGTQLYVTYAMQLAPANTQEVLGAGLGYVDIFDMSGNFVSRFASAGVLNAPWGVAVAPTGFGSMAGDVLIGNFGDGHINGYTTAGATVGPLAVNSGGTVAIPGLWALVFGNGDTDKPVTTLFYTAGFADQTDGVFGSITPSASTGGTNPY